MKNRMQWKCWVIFLTKTRMLESRRHDSEGGLCRSYVWVMSLLIVYTNPKRKKENKSRQGFVMFYFNENYKIQDDPMDIKNKVLFWNVSYLVFPMQGWNDRQKRKDSFETTQEGLLMLFKNLMIQIYSCFILSL